MLPLLQRRHASVVVHQGGAGTTARALCAGVPTVILPLGMDTWDNALRAERAGTSVTVPREGMTAGGLSAAILKAANDKTVKDAALKVRTHVKSRIPPSGWLIILMLLPKPCLLLLSASISVCGCGGRCVLNSGRCRCNSGCEACCLRGCRGDSSPRRQLERGHPPLARKHRVSVGEADRRGSSCR